MIRSAPFVGRVAELTLLEEALASAILRRGGAVVISGEPGVGKTRLATELCDRAERRGARVLWARCASAVETPAFWPFAQLLQAAFAGEDPPALETRFGPGSSDAAALAGRATIVPSDAVPDAGAAGREPMTEQQRFRFFDAVTAMLSSLTSERPVVVVFDDAHAADPGCLDLLLFLARAIRDVRMLVVATMRSAEAHREHVAPLLLGSLAREATTISLGGWNRDEVGAFLAGRRGGGASPSLVEAVHRASAGNPFFVGEIAALLAATGHADGVRGDDGAALPVPVHVRQAVRSRLADLPGTTAGALRVAAVFGLAFDARTTAAVSNAAVEDVTEAFSRGVEAGVLERRSENTWAFRHEIVRDVLYEDQDGTERRRLHLRCATVLAEQPRRGDAVADHRLRALPCGDLETAVRGALAAAGAAARALAYEQAMRWCRRGLAALDDHAGLLPTDGPPLPALRGELLLTLGDACWTVGQHDESRRAFEDAADVAGSWTADPAPAARLLARAALGLGGRQQRAHVQYDERVVAMLKRAIDALGDGDAALLARLRARLAYSLYALPGSRAERERLCTEAVELARRDGDAEALGWVLADARWALWGPVTLAERRAAGDELLGLARRRGDREAALVEHGWSFLDAIERGDRIAADEALAAYRGGAAELRLPWYEWYAKRFECLVAQVEGRLDDAERVAAEALALGERAGHPDAALAFSTQLLGVRMVQDRLVEVEAGVEMTIARYPDVLLWRRLLSRIHDAQGRHAEAAAEVERARRGELVEAPGDFLHLPSLVILAELVAASGDPATVARVRDALEPFSGQHVVLGFAMAFLGPVDQYLGELEAAGGRAERARSLFERAASQATALGAPRWAARARSALRLLDSVAAPSAAGASRPSRPNAEATRAALVRNGSGWHVEFAGGSFHLGSLRGVLYLWALLGAPDREIHVLDLAAMGQDRSDADPGAAPVSDRADAGDAGPVLDEQAKRTYRARLVELESEIDEATQFADSGRVAVLRAEIDALRDELVRAVGLHGRDRRSNAAAERARVAVVKRIRTALERIGQQDAGLQRYLESTIRTGSFCVYQPDPGRPVDWRLEA